MGTRSDLGSSTDAPLLAPNVRQGWLSAELAPPHLRSEWFECHACLRDIFLRQMLPQPRSNSAVGRVWEGNNRVSTQAQRATFRGAIRAAVAKHRRRLLACLHD